MDNTNKKYFVPDGADLIGSKECNNIDISVIIVNFRTPEVTIECISSFYKHLTCNFEIIVVDNNSNDNSEELIKKKYNEIHWIQIDKNMGYGYAMNKGFEQSNGNYILILNSDIMILSDFYNSLTEKYIELNAGIIGIKLILPDGKTQQTASTFPRLMTIFANEIKILQKIKKFNRYTLQIDTDKIVHKVDWVTGAFMFISREIYQKISGFNDSYFMYYEDVDLCRKTANQGFSNFYITNHQATHKHCYSVNKQNKGSYNFYKAIEKESAIKYIHEFYNIKTFNKFIFLYRLIFVNKIIKESIVFILLFPIKRKREKISYAIRTNLVILKKINSIPKTEFKGK